MPFELTSRTITVEPERLEQLHAAGWPSTVLIRSAPVTLAVLAWADPWPDPYTSTDVEIDTWWTARAQAIGDACREQGRCPLCLEVGDDLDCVGRPGDPGPLDDELAEAILGITPPPRP